MSLADKVKNRVSFLELVKHIGLQYSTRDNRYGWMQSIYINKKQKTGSLKIDFSKNVYCDYGDNNKGGSVIDFYADYYNVDIGTAIKELARIFNIEDVPFNPAVREKFIQVEEKSFDEWVDKDIIQAFTDEERYLFEERISLSGYKTDIKNVLTESCIKEYKAFFSMCFLPAKRERLRLTHKILMELYFYCSHKPNKGAIDYLTIKRGLSIRALQHFKIFTIDNYNQVNMHMKKHFSLSDLQKSGLYNDKGNLIFYGHRIIIPYLSKGYITYCRGRYYDSDGNTQSDNKYLGLRSDALRLNSPKRLFNEDILTTLHPLESLFFVEGELDVVAMFELDKHSVGIPGTSNLPEDLTKLQRLNKFIYAGESDEAGNKLFSLLKSKLSEMNKSITKITFPDNIKDANELLCGH
jgi:DNA primase